MLNICNENKRVIKEIKEVYHLEYANPPSFTQTLNPSQQSTTTQASREKRQILLAIATGITNSLVSSFSTSQFFSMGSHNEDREALITNQNHSISCLEVHEIRIPRNEAHIKSLKSHYTKLEAVLIGTIKQDVVFSECTFAVIFGSILRQHLNEVQQGLYPFLRNNLSFS